MLAVSLASIPERKWSEEFADLVRKAGLADPEYQKGLEAVKNKEKEVAPASGSVRWQQCRGGSRYPSRGVADGPKGQERGNPRDQGRATLPEGYAVDPGG